MLKRKSRGDALLYKLTTGAGGFGFSELVFSELAQAATRTGNKIVIAAFSKGLIFIKRSLSLN